MTATTTLRPRSAGLASGSQRLTTDAIVTGPGVRRVIPIGYNTGNAKSISALLAAAGLNVGSGQIVQVNGKTVVDERALDRVPEPIIGEAVLIQVLQQDFAG